MMILQVKPPVVVVLVKVFFFSWCGLIYSLTVHLRQLSIARLSGETTETEQQISFYYNRSQIFLMSFKSVLTLYLIRVCCFKYIYCKSTINWHIWHKSLWTKLIRQGSLFECLIFCIQLCSKQTKYIFQDCAVYICQCSVNINILK